jgi:peptide/nickel transport system substrate-binding protein
MSGSISRRDLLRLVVLGAGGAALAACAPAAPSPAATPVAEALTPTPAEAVPAAEAERRKTVIFDIDGGRVVDPELWNPFVPGSRRDHGYHQAVLEPLFILNYTTGQLVPWLGESMEANETLDVWTLKLREGVKWSDGEDFNADDVVFTYQMLLDHAPELSYSAGLSEWLDRVEKVDDLTVRFTLKKPNPRFQLDWVSVKAWGNICIMPEHIWKDQDPLTFKFYDPTKGWPVGTGPYKLVSVSPTEFVYLRDDNWWGAKAGFKPLPKPEKLIWTWAGPEETRAALMAEGKLDSLMDITLGTFLALKERNPNVIAWYKDKPYAWVPDPCVRTLELNLTKEPWNDKEMRWAINYAMNRDQIVEIAYEGTTFIARHFFPEYKPLKRFIELLEKEGIFEKYPITKHDPELAKQIIESKGWKLGSDGYYYKDGKQLSMDITCHEAFIELQRNAQVMVEQFQAIGINATMRLEAGGTWGDNFAFGRFDAKSGWQACGSINEPWASMQLFSTKWLVPVGERASGNQWRWSGPAAEEYSALVDEIGTLPLGDPKIDELFVKAMWIWYDELPLIPVTQARKLVPFDTTYWVGWPTAENDYDHPCTWWQSTHVIIHHLEPAK